MLSDTSKEVIKLLRGVSNRHTLQDAFTSWVEMGYCAVAKTMTRDPDKAEALEADYMRQVGRWPKDDVRETFPKALAMIMTGYGRDDQSNRVDYLGEIAGEVGTLSASMGQFFTPIEVSRLMTEISMADAVDKLRSGKKFIKVSEPAAGAGAMVLAAADSLRAAGFDPATSMWVEATDLNLTAHRMCYLAMSFAGIAGAVTHGNTLTLETFCRVPTPPALWFYQKNGDPWAKPRPRMRRRRNHVKSV